MRVHNSYSSSRLETNGSAHRAAGGRDLRQADGRADRTVEVNHRSARSCASSSNGTLNDVTGARGGIPDPRHQRRRQPAVAHDVGEEGVGHGRTLGPRRPQLSHHRSRSVTRTVSPLAARRTYSLRQFFRILRPTARIIQMLPCQNPTFREVPADSGPRS